MNAVKKTVSFILITVILVSAFSVPVFADGGAVPLDYSRADAGYSCEISAGELLAHTLNPNITEAEKSVIDECGIALSYYDRIPTRSVTLSYDGELSLLAVTAFPYSYVARNGQTVTWIPKSADLNGKILKTVNDNGVYCAEFKTEAADSFNVKVEYAATFAIDSDTASYILNYGYNSAVQYERDKETYDRDSEEYTASKTAYIKYQNGLIVYEARLGEYNEYLRRLAEYEKKLSAYEKYTKEKSAYESALKEYNRYIEELDEYRLAVLKYEKYIEDSRKYIGEYNDYTKYLTRYNACKGAMTAIESVFTKDSVGHQMYATLLGDTVAEVVEKQELIEIGGCDKHDIKNAGDSTEVLRALLGEYAKLKTEEAKFDFYVKHYDELRENFTLLYSSLKSLYNSTPLQTMLIKREKFQRYQGFVAQLYVISTALDDTVTLDDEWNISCGVRASSLYGIEFGLLEVMEESLYVNDTNTSDPDGLEWPEYMSEPTKPEAVECPAEPEAVPEPVKTWTDDLTKPTEPEIVTKPDPPAVADDPGDEIPSAPVASENLIRLVDEIKSGKTGEHGRVTESLYFNAVKTVDCELNTNGSVSVRFCDYDGSLIGSYSVMPGGNAEYLGSDPTREATNTREYKFDCWRDEDGNIAELSSVTENSTFYASYIESVRQYKVVWAVGDNTETVYYEFGAEPKYTGSIPLTDESAGRVFKCWSPEITKVSGDAVYVARFLETESKIRIVWSVPDKDYIQVYDSGDEIKPPEVETVFIKGDSIYTFVGWDREIAKATENTIYTAIYSKKKIISSDEGDCTVTTDGSAVLVECPSESVVLSSIIEYAKQNSYGLSVQFKNGRLALPSALVGAIDGNLKLSMTVGDGGRTVSVVAYNAQGESIEALEGAVVTVGCEYTSDDSVTVRMKTADGAGVLIPSVISDGELRFAVKNAGEYSIQKEYKVRITAEGRGTAKAERSTYAEGDAVVINCVPDVGYRIAGITVVLSDGRNAGVTDGGRFSMPGCDVDVKVEFERALFKIRFISNGKIVSEKEYFYGDKVELPDTPDKYREGDTVYSFSRWTPDVTLVTSDAEYTAEFKQSVIGDVDKTFISEYKVSYFILAMLAIVAVAVAAAAIAVPIIIVRRRKNKSNKFINK